MYDYDRRPRSKVASGYGPCPICGLEGVMRCKCFIADTKCPNGHVWHFDGDEMHLGHFPHDGTGDHANCQVVR